MAWYGCGFHVMALEGIGLYCFKFIGWYGLKCNKMHWMVLNGIVWYDMAWDGMVGLDEVWDGMG